MFGDGVTADCPQLLTIREAADHLGVHYMTVYRYMRIGRLEAQRQGGRWLVDARNVEHLRPNSQSSPCATPLRQARSPMARPVERLLARLVEGDGPGCWAIVEEGLLRGSPTEVYVNLLAPSLRRLGEGWVDGSISIAHEHRATAATIRLVGRLSPMFSRPGRRRWGTVVLAGATGDRHLIPMALLGDVLRGEGFTVVDLGSDLPTDSLLEAVDDVAELLAVGISVSVDACRGAAAATVAALHMAHPGVPVLVGGPAVGQRSIAESLGADHWAPEATTTATLLGELSAQRRALVS